MEQASITPAADAEKTAEVTQATEAAAVSPAAKTEPAGKGVAVRLLRDSELGKADDVITLSAADAKQAELAGKADSDKAAVKYARSLQKAAEKSPE